MKLITITATLAFSSAVWATPDSAPIAFDPVQAKAENCQYLEILKQSLSGESAAESSVSANAALPPPLGMAFQAVAATMCSFSCAAGERICDERLNPNREPFADGFFFTGFSFAKPDRFPGYGESSGSCNWMFDQYSSYDILSEAFTSKEVDEYGIQHFEAGVIYTHPEGMTCKESTEQTLVCDDKGSCDLVEKYSQAHQEYQEKMQMQQYQDSCVIATEQTCADIAKERQQCMLYAVSIIEPWCAERTEKDALWMYRSIKEAIADKISEKESKEHAYKDKDMYGKKDDSPVSAGAKYTHTE